MNGRIVTNSTSSNYLDISDVSSGIYFISIRSNEKNFTEKIHISKVN